MTKEGFSCFAHANFTQPPVRLQNLEQRAPEGEDHGTCRNISPTPFRVKQRANRAILSDVLGLFGSSRDRKVVGNEETQDCYNVRGLHMLFQL